MALRYKHITQCANICLCGYDCTCIVRTNATDVRLERLCVATPRKSQTIDFL